MAGIKISDFREDGTRVVKNIPAGLTFEKSVRLVEFKDIPGTTKAAFC